MRLFVLLKSLLLLFLFSLSSYALDVPPAPTGYVNDRAGMLDTTSRLELEQKLKAFEGVTSNQVIVATFPSLSGESLEDFSIRLAEKWKIGQKGRDNGVILLIFRDDRKLRIETGYGLEGALPDATAKSIIQNQILPHFKQGDFKGGIFAGVEAIMAATKGEYQGTPPVQAGINIATIIVLIVVLLLFLGFLFILSQFPPGGGGTYSSGGYSSWPSGRSSWGSSSWGSSGGGFSGGGGGFGGGGASGGW